MTEQKAQGTVINVQQEVPTITHSEGPNDSQKTSNENRKVTVEEENSEEGNLLKKSKDLDENENKTNDATSSTSLSETVDVIITEKTKKSNANDSNKEPSEDDYDPSKSIIHRVNTAIKKFRKQQKFDQLWNQLFSSYLNFGGINSSQQSDNPDADLENMEVDFANTVRVYLSGFLIDRSGYADIGHFREGPLVIISFINYLLDNKVCPEYEDDMQEALRFAHKAKEELPNCKALDQNAPGKFNKACSLLFGGELYGTLDDPWNGEELVAELIGISKDEGKQLIKKVFGANALEELTQIKEGSRTSLECEIVEVLNDSEQFNLNNNTQDNDVINLKKIVLRERNVATAEPFYVYESSDVVNYAKPGIRITADFHKLSNGFCYWDKIMDIHPTYYLICEDED